MRRKLVVYGAISVVVLKALVKLRQRWGNGAIPAVLFSVFLQDLKRGRVERVLMHREHFEVYLSSNPTMRYTTLLGPLIDRTRIVEKLAQSNIVFGTVPRSRLSQLWPVLITLVPFLYLLLTYRMLGKLYNGGNDSVGKHEDIDAKRRQQRRVVTFQDVAGIDAARAELEEIVDALKDPGKYARMGAKMPRGILLCGPSGTGKTLLARALSNEASKFSRPRQERVSFTRLDIPFMSCSASDFVEMLVGRGAARVRDLFTRASKCAPSIIFVDELDALGTSLFVGTKSCNSP